MGRVMVIAEPVNLEITLQLLEDIASSTASLLVNDFGVKRKAIRVTLQDQPPGLTLKVDRDWLPKPLRPPAVLNEVMVQVCTSLRATLDAALPSLSHGLGMRYLPAAGTIEIGIGPDTAPIYPHIITATVKELRLTPAGRVALAKGDIKLWQ